MAHVPFNVSNIAALQKLLEGLTANAYALKVPAEFVEKFFAGRHIIRAAAAAQLQASRRLLQGIEYALREGGNHLWGQSTIEENYALTRVLELLRPQTVAEVGLFRGQTALTIHTALRQNGGWSYMGVDPDALAIATTREVLRVAGVAANDQFLPETSDKWRGKAPADFALIDGDHAYGSVAADFAGAYNLLPAGGVIALHDVGSPVYGCTQQGPGHLLHRVLPGVLKDGAALFCLDAMCRETTMQKLAEGAYTNGTAEAEAIARVTMADTVSGWGGLGFVVKIEGESRVDLAELQKQAPAELAPAGPPPKRGTILGRVARKIARHIP
ncbi:MAG TPA: class I SAM-dependent methyltransferase [Opitutales bacterium]|nr:class I SAM-dependent methyltransferase [Opitutales bacterium]